jgi:CRISPR-associated protein (TIGR02584 family)
MLNNAINHYQPIIKWANMQEIIKQPHHYPHRILLLVMGMTPQIVTETLYTLAVATAEPYIPTEIHLITPADGAKSATIALLGVGKEKGKFHQFCDDYDFNDIQFTKDNIHIIEGNSHFTSDSQATKHNKIASSFITEKIRQFSQREESALHVSLAGGRKTMSYYTGYALSLYGRMQDKLSHVLVDASFQNNKDFFYPRPNAEMLAVNNIYYNTDDAMIILADIPYVRMRYNIPESLLAGKVGFQETINVLQASMEPPNLQLKPSSKEIICSHISLKLSASEYAFYHWMCQRKLNNQTAFNPVADEFMSDFLKIYARFVKKDGGMYQRAEHVANDKDAKAQKDWFWGKRSKLNSKLTQKLGKRLAQAYLIENSGEKGESRYQIAIEKQAINIYSSLEPFITSS